MIDGDLDELTEAPTADVAHATPLDEHAKTIWFLEPKPSDGVLTKDGVTQIAYHKYKSGSSTSLDLLLNDGWQYLTDLLPMTIAPNMVTTLGAMHCVFAYMVTWWYSPNFAGNVPAFVCVLNAYCNAAYYTFDCMDGKQARRTGSSSPLGQLFDHGIDCLCLQQQLSSIMCCISPNSGLWLWGAQLMLQYSFYLAQWEEYYTGILPHATGNFGVTEVNYGLAAFSLMNALIPDRNAFYSQPVANFLPFALPVDSETFQLKHALLMCWFLMSTVLCALCMGRVLSLPGTRVSALSKLVSPLLLCVAPLFVDGATLGTEIRWFSLGFGMVLTQVTIKLIVFSMARRSVAALQIVDVVPPVAACLWIRYDARLKAPGIHLMLQILTVVYVARLLLWTNKACRQICERLDIYVFSLKAKNKAE